MIWDCDRYFSDTLRAGLAETIPTDFASLYG